MVNRIDLRESVPVNIIKWANLESTINALFNDFEAWEQRNAELINKFFNQSYFRWEESLINKLIEVKPNIEFNDIKDEWINLALLTNTNWMWEFNDCLGKINNNEIKRAFIEEIFDKVQNEIWTWDPYSDFDTECAVPWDTNVLWYLQTVLDYLNWKEWEEDWKKAIDILQKVDIKNENINSRLHTNQIPTGTNLSNPAVPASTRDDFDKLLSFEIWKEASRTIDIVGDLSNKIGNLFINTFPAVNTIISENDELKYDESKLWEEYHRRAQAINSNTNLNGDIKQKQLNDLRWKYYLKYVKTKNAKIGDALEQLYNNNFDYSKIESNVLKNYIDKVVETRLKMLFDSWINEAIKLNFWNLDEFRSFCKNLADPTKRNITLNDVNIVVPGGTTSWSVHIPIQKTIVEWENSRLKENINQFWSKEKSYDALPIRYEINKSDIDNLDITIEDKTKLLNFLSKFNQWDKYVIEWKDVWMLIYLFFVINRRFPITSFKSADQEEIQKLFWNTNTKKRNENAEWKNWNEGENGDNTKNDIEDNTEGKTEHNTEDDMKNNSDGNPEESDEWNEELTPEKFKSKMEELWPWKFEDWSEIWLPINKSELPGWWYQWMKLKISDVNMKKWIFKWTASWWELKFKSKLEWKSGEFKMNKKTLDKFIEISKKTSGSDNNVWLQPNPDKSDFNSFRENLNGRLWTTNFSFPPSWTTWNGNKFMQKIVDNDWKEKEAEVKYFWASSDDKSTYKIEYNPVRRSFTVSSTFNWDEEWKDWKTEKKRFSYKRDMDWNNFLIFFTQKWLYPQTEEEAKDAIARQDHEFKMVNGWKWKLNRFSFNNVKNVFKTIKWNIKKKMDEYNKAQDEKLEDILIWDWWLYNKLAGVLGFIPSMKGWLWELQQEYYNERDNKTWKKIEYYLKIFQSDPDFWTTFEQVPPFARILWWKSYKSFITDLAKPNSSRSKDDIHKAAALLLANIEKWSSPYRWLAGKENSGLWVRVLLGDAHYNQFMRDKQKCIDDLKKAWKEKSQIQDVLATCEMDYIINNVSWSNWKLKYFGSHEDRWLPWEEGTDYIDNPSKRLLSNQFADKLKWSYKWRFNQSSVEESLGKITHNDFDLAKEDFKRLIKSSRFPWAIANLKKMFLLAKNEEQQAEYQKCFLLYMLSGVLDVNGKKDLRDQTYQWAKTMSFLPGMLAKETWHSQHVAALLDNFCQEKWYWKFSESVKSYFHEWDLKNWELKIGSLISELDSRWDINKMKDFEKYSKSDFPSKNFPEGSVLSNLKDDFLNTNIENIDNSLLKNPLVANSGWLLSNINVVRNRMDIRDWEFTWNDNDEINNKRDFWDKIANEVRKTPLTVENTVLLLNQYCERFQIHDKEKIYRWIKTANERKKEIGKIAKYKNDDGTWDDMGIISQKEIDSIIWYTFQWTVMSEYFSGRRLPKKMMEALKAFQDKFKEAFDVGILNNPEVVSKVFNINEWSVKPLFLWSWSKYNKTVTWREYSNDDDKDEKSRVKRHFTSWNFINHDIANIEKRLKNLPSGDYESVTIGDLDVLYNRYKTE